MRKLPRAWLLTVVVASLLTLTFALLAFFLYVRTEAAVIERHSLDQQLMVQLAATALAQRVDSYVHASDTLVSALQRFPREQWGEALRTLPVPAPARSLFVVEPNGRIHLRGDPASLPALEAAVLPWRGAREPILSNPFPPAEKAREVALLLPVFSQGEVVGQLGILFPFASLLETLLSQGSLSRGFNLSLLDEQGMVLANTRHPEMLGRRIPASGEACLPCHASFHLERQMLEGKAGVDRLQVGREPAALVAFSPVEGGGRRWSLALSEPYTAIIADTRRGFRGITLLLGLSLLVAVVAAVLTLQYRVGRRRAEERAQLAERRAVLEQQLRQNEQLAAIGRMTSQIAHQINTPLATLGLNVSYLQGEVGRRLGNPSPEINEVTDAILAEIDRLKRVVNDYLRFSRLPQPVFGEESLRGLVESFLDFVEPEARERGVQLEVNLAQEPAEARLDADLFRQAFLNLVRNSFEAMPAGGVLQVRLERAGDEWVLEVADSGRGIPADLLPRVFDPFFTTKKDGTGLGLAHVRRVVEQHGGTIACTSQPGQGTRFTVRLPAATPSPDIPMEEVSVLQEGR